MPGCWENYVRYEKALSLMDAIRKSSLMPARRLEAMSPQMRQKGRVKIGSGCRFIGVRSEYGDR